MGERRGRLAGFWPLGREEQLLLALSSLGSVLTLGWVIRLSSYGFDYTDDAFYLIWAARPFDYRASVSQFGFVYHPLYLLVNGSVPAFRSAGFAITFLLGAVAAWCVMRRTFTDGTPAPATRGVLACAFGTLGLLYAVFEGQWLPSPSYNSLALQAVLVTTTALCLADRSWSKSSVAGWVLGGLGLGLAFLAKPTTAAALGLLAGCYFLVAGQARLRQVLLAAATAGATLVFSALVIDGSIGVFVQRHVAALEMARLLQAGYSLDGILRLEPLPLDTTSLHLAVLLGAALAAALWLTQWRPARAPAAGALLALAVLAGGASAAFHAVPASAITGLQRSMLLLGLVLAALLAGFALMQARGLAEVGRMRWALGVTLVIFPYAYGFGSNSNYWAAIGCASILVALGALAVLAPLGRRSASGSLFLVLALALQGMSFVLLEQSVMKPYRQNQPLAEHGSRLPVGSSELFVSQADADYLVPIYEAARRNGFRPGTPVIDLSGRSPGLLYAMQARNIGLPWNLSGYPGTAAYVERGFEWAACDDLAAAWVLAQSKGTTVPDRVLAAIGADLQHDYAALATTVSPTGQEQTLMKPLRPPREAEQTCRLARSKRGTQG